MERLGEDVARELRRFGPQGALADVVAAWSAAVGEAIARNAWPARIARDGTLHVNTASAAWAYELAHLAPEVLGRLQAALGGTVPRAVRFAPGAVPEASPAAAERPPPPRPMASREERELAAALAAGIEDEELRGLVARAAAASLAGRRGDR